MDLFGVMTGKIARMSYVNRYSSFSVNRRENVAEHSWWVAFISYLVAVDLLERGENVRVDVLMQRAVMHDISECVSGDVIRSYKHSSPEIRDAMKLADYHNVCGLAQDWGPPGDAAVGGWMYAKSNDLEGEIISFADMAAVAFYCREEDRSGNRAIRQVLAEMYEQWFHEFSTHPLLGQYVLQMFPDGRWPSMLREESLPAQRMYPIMHDHREGPVTDHEFEGMGQP